MRTVLSDISHVGGPSARDPNSNAGTRPGIIERQLPNAVTLNTARAQTAYIQGNGPKMMQGMVSGTMGGLELSKLTVFWNIIDSILEFY